MGGGWWVFFCLVFAMGKIIIFGEWGGIREVVTGVVVHGELFFEMKHRRIG